MDFVIISVMKTLNFSTTPDITHVPALATVLASKCQSISAQWLGETWGHFVLNRHCGGFLWMYDIVHCWGSPSRFTSRTDKVTHTVCVW